MRSVIVYAVFSGILAIVGRQGRLADASKPIPPPTMILTPGELDFGMQPVGTSSVAKSATLQNVSSAPLAIRDISASGIDFTQTNNCPEQLNPGAQCAIQVTFKPAITGLRLGTVIVTDSDPSPTLFLVLRGKGE